MRLPPHRLRLPLYDRFVLWTMHSSALVFYGTLALMCVLLGVLMGLMATLALVL